ncbi:MAG TPA: oxidoreductase [Cytophagales bacterium]|jgi:predicted dehydrogenase|nr:oxidoreductase [Cytophagales bacterium]
MKKENSIKMSRRDFVGGTIKSAAAFTIVPSTVISGLGYTAPSDKLNIVGVGVGGRGGGVLKEMTSENIIGLCDVDWKYSKKIFGEFPNAKKFKDWRVMFEEMHDDIDAVVVGTPDHTHAIISINAMKEGWHVYCDKPLTHSVYEARKMTEVANEMKVATQMGNQGNSSDDIRVIKEWIESGIIGEVTEVHAFTNRPIWPQGLERPANGMWVPDHLAWDLFIGPAPMRPYHEVYTPWNWRAWWDFGTGALGDMACHILDPVFYALNLGYPTSAEASSSQVNTESAPISSSVHYSFPARGKKQPAVEVHWYDGGMMPERPAELEDGEMMGDWGGGAIFVGTKGKLMCDTYAANPRLLGKLKDTPKPKQTIDRITTNHYMDWVRACKESPESRKPASSNFDYAGPLTEMVLMGNLAIRLQDLKRRLQWDGENMKVTNIGASDEIRVVTTDRFNVIDGHPHFDTKYATMNAKEAAEEYIKHTYRDGWTM